MSPQSASIDLRTVRAIITDVDGTLYRQRPVQLRMALRLLGESLQHPLSARRTLCILRTYRHAQEELREIATSSVAHDSTASDQHGDIAAEQLRVTCIRTGFPAEIVSLCVERWMGTEPLPILASAIYPDLPAFLRWAKARGLRIAACSDYSARAKLKAMDIEQYFDAVVCAPDPEVGVFKPHPRGLQVAAGKLGVECHEAIFIGDRPEVDGVAAARAGITPVIIGESRRSDGASYDFLQVRSFTALQRLLDPRSV